MIDTQLEQTSELFNLVLLLLLFDVVSLDEKPVILLEPVLLAVLAVVLLLDHDQALIFVHHCNFLLLLQGLLHTIASFPLAPFTFTRLALSITGVAAYMLEVD